MKVLVKLKRLYYQENNDGILGKEASKYTGLLNTIFMSHACSIINRDVLQSVVQKGLYIHRSYHIEVCPLTLLY